MSFNMLQEQIKKGRGLLLWDFLLSLQRKWSKIELSSIFKPSDSAQCHRFDFCSTNTFSFSFPFFFFFWIVALLASMLNGLMPRGLAQVLIAPVSDAVWGWAPAETQNNNGKREGFKRFYASLCKQSRSFWRGLRGSVCVYDCKYKTIGGWNH